MSGVFLICALSLPPLAFHGSHRYFANMDIESPSGAWRVGSGQKPVIQRTPLQIEYEKTKLKDWIRKNNPDAEVFIHPDPNGNTLKKHGWEKVPFTWRGQQIWIQRKHKTDVKMQRIGASA